MQYVAIDQMPENGCKIQYLVGGEDNDEQPNNKSSLLHCTQVLKTVISPWFGSNCIVVCANSYLASVGAAKELNRNGQYFIGVVKTATRGFPKRFLTSVELNQRGDFFVLVSDSADELDPLWLLSCGWIGDGDTSLQRLSQKELQTLAADGGK
jgi:hypothetical protein